MPIGDVQVGMLNLMNGSRIASPILCHQLPRDDQKLAMTTSCMPPAAASLPFPENWPMANRMASAASCAGCRANFLRQNHDELSQSGKAALCSCERSMRAKQRATPLHPLHMRSYFIHTLQRMDVHRCAMASVMNELRTHRDTSIFSGWLPSCCF